MSNNDIRLQGSVKSNKKRSFLIFLLVLLIFTGAIASTSIFPNQGKLLDDKFSYAAVPDEGQPSVAGTTIETEINTDPLSDFAGDPMGTYYKAASIPAISVPNLYGTQTSIARPYELLRWPASEDTGTGNITVKPLIIRYTVQMNDIVASGATITCRLPYAATNAILSGDQATIQHVQSLELEPRQAFDTLSNGDGTRELKLNLIPGLGGQYIIMFTVNLDRNTYKSAIADFTPHFNNYPSTDTAIGEKLTMTFDDDGELFLGLEDSRGQKRGNAFSSNFYDGGSITESGTKAYWTSPGVGNLITTIGDLYHLNEYLVINNPNTYVAPSGRTYYSGGAKKNLEETIILPAEVELVSLTADWTSSAGIGGTTVITRTNRTYCGTYSRTYFSGRPSYSMATLRYTTVPALGASDYQFETKTSYLTPDQPATDPPSHINSAQPYYPYIEDTRPRTPSISASSEWITNWANADSIDGYPGGGIGNNMDYINIVSAVAKKDYVNLYGYISNNGLVPLKDASCKFKFDGDFLDLRHIWVEVNNNNYANIRFSEYFESLTITYSSGSSLVVQSTDSSLFYPNRTLTTDFKDFIQSGVQLDDYAMANSPGGYPVGLEFKMRKETFEIGEAVYWQIVAKVREQKRDGTAFNSPTDRLYLSSEGLAYTEPPNTTTLSSISGASYYKNIYNSTQDIPLRARPISSRISVDPNGTNTIVSGGRNALINGSFTMSRETGQDYYNGLLKEPTVFIVLPKDLQMDTTSLEVKLSRGNTNGNLNVNLPPTSQTAINFTNFATTPGMEVNIYSFTILSDLSMRKDYKIGFSFEIDVPLGVSIGRNYISTGIAPKKTDGSMWTGNFSGSADVYDLNGDGSYTNTLPQATTYFEIVNPTMYATSLQTYSDINQNWLADAQSFLHASNFNLARVKDETILRFRTVNFTPQPHSGSVYLKRLGGTSLLPNLSSIEITRIVAGNETTESLAGYNIQYTTSQNSPETISEAALGIFTTISALPPNWTYLKLDNLSVVLGDMLDIKLKYEIEYLPFDNGEVARSLSVHNLEDGIFYKTGNYAGISIGTHKVHYDLNGATTPSAYASLLGVVPQSTNLIPATPPERLGYDFVGWDVSLGGKNPPATNVLSTTALSTIIYDTNTNSVTLKARWQVVNYPINYQNLYNSYMLTRPSSYSIETIRPISISRPSKDAYKFLGWSVAYANPNILDIVDEPDWIRDYQIPAGALGDIDLIAHFEFDIKYDLDGGANPSDQPNTYRDSDTAGASTFAIGAPSKFGYQFDGWTADFTQKDFDAYDITTATWPLDLPSGSQGEVQLRAHWSKDPSVRFSILYDGNGHTSGLVPVDVSSGAYLIDDEVKILSEGNMIKDAHEFLGWSKNMNSSSPEYKKGDRFAINGDIQLFAIWEKLPSLPPASPPSDQSTRNDGASALDSDKNPSASLDKQGRTKLKSNENSKDKDRKSTNYSGLKAEANEKASSGLSMVLASLSFLISLCLLISMLRARQFSKFRLFAVISGLIPLAVSLMLDGLPMQISLINEHTPIVAICFIGHAIVSAAAISSFATPAGTLGKTNIANVNGKHLKK